MALKVIKSDFIYSIFSVQCIEKTNAGNDVENNNKSTFLVIPLARLRADHLGLSRLLFLMRLAAYEGHH